MSAMTVASNILLFSIALSLSLLLLSTADENNLILTGDVLLKDAQLSNPAATFVMQDDCNLVLYAKGRGFQSNTHGLGVNCSLTLTNAGQLTITSFDGSTVWSSTPPPKGKPGKYAAVLRPDGHVVVYGPIVWSTAPPVKTGHSSIRGAVGFDGKAVIPMANNVLFSDQILYGNGKLWSRDYSFTMKDDCNLVFEKGNDGGKGVLWQSGTLNKGRHCFVRLNHRGQLSVEDDRSATLWAAKPVASEGDYVLVVQINGVAVVYGPAVWSTATA